MQSTYKGVERRKAERILTRKAVANCRILSAENNGRFHFTVSPLKDISTKGTRIECEDQIQKGTLAFLNVDLDVVMHTIGVIAKVVWMNKKENGYEVGLNFCCWPKDNDRAMIDTYIKRKTACEGKPGGNIKFTAK